MLLKTGTDLFLQIPDGSSQRFLHRAQVVAISESGCVVALYADLHLEVEDEFPVYFDSEHEFLQQQARVSALLPEGPGSQQLVPPPGATEALHSSESPQLLVCLETLADPISANNRSDYRIEVTSSDAAATLDGERCQLEDVSPTGFAVFSKRSHERGSILPASIRHTSREYSGRICIRSIREVKSQTRYGVSYVAEPGGRGELADGLRAISQAIRREHPG